MTTNWVLDFASLRMSDVEEVGGKNASLGEMISQLAQTDVQVPGGFATTAMAYRVFMQENQLEEKISKVLAELDIEDVNALAKVGAEIRAWIIEAQLPKALDSHIRSAYEQMQNNTTNLTVAVRSSATAEDLPDASFAGQQESFLNIAGIDNVLLSIKEVFASLYNDRAISYRVHKGFDHGEVAISAGVQQMVRSDSGASGVMFSIDTESGFDQVVFITSSYGLGEMVVQGAVNPDEFYVHKPSLAAGHQSIIRRSLGSKAEQMIFSPTPEPGKSVEVIPVAQADCDQFSLSDQQVQLLAKYAVIIEKHYGRAMDIEWGLDGEDGKLYILQARPETVKSQETPGGQEQFILKQQGSILCQGRAIGQRIGAGAVVLVDSAAEMDRVKPGDVLVTDMTDPNWEPVMKRASAIVTNRGGRTCHAAIIARELGIPAVVGCGDATKKLKQDQQVTVACTEGDTGLIFDGLLEFTTEQSEEVELAEIPLDIMMNVGNPDLAFRFAQMPNKGVGLARLEFIINNGIGVHPKAVLDYPNVDSTVKREIDVRAAGYSDPRSFFVSKLVEGVATIAAAFWPKKVIVRLSDFKSNEYRKLVAGEDYEPEEENPMLGFRGAARYLSPDYAECFAMECEAMRRVRDEMGLSNVELMVPFVRTPAEGKAVIDLMASHGLKQGENGLKIIMMCELPSNALLADAFLEHFDGFSIGSNDLTQLTLGLDRDSGLVAEAFDERDPAVKALLSMAISACNRQNKYVGICGQGPSDHLDFALWLRDQGIQSLSLNPDTVIDTWQSIAG